MLHVGMLELEQSSFCNCHRKDWVRQEASEDATSRGDFDEGQDIYMVLEYVLIDCWFLQGRK